DGQLAAHSAGEVAADRETQTDTAFATRQARIELHEGLENVVQLIGGNADTRIAYFDLDPLVGTHAAHIDATASIGEFERVVHEIDHDLSEPLTIGVDGEL